jgi:protein disulfide-isomerase
MGQQAISWQPTLDVAKRIAGQTNRLVLIHFWSTSCGPCQRMEHEVFTRPEVAAAIEAAYVPVKLNADYFPGTARQFNITHLPTDVVITPQGQVVASSTGARAFDKYIDMLNQVASNARVGAGQSYAQMPTASVPGPAPVQPPVQPAYGMPGPGSGLQPDLAGAAPTQAGNPAASPAMPPTYGQGGPVASAPATAGTGYPSYVPPANSAPVTQQPPAMPGPSAPAVANVAQPNSGWTAPAANAAEQPAANAGGYPGLPNQMPPSWQVATGNADPRSQTPAVAENPAGAAVAPQVHAGNPPLALDGYCPVQLSEKERWVKGNPRWGLIHRGRTYLFAGPEEQSRFFADPDRFAPVLSGGDVVLATEQGQQVEGKREYGVWFGARVYLFSSEDSLRRFATDPYRYAQGGDQKAPVAVEANQGMSAGAGQAPRY